MKIKRTSNLIYRCIDELYYITNPLTREIVILNNVAFAILKYADNRTIDDLCQFLSKEYIAASNAIMFEKKNVQPFIEELEKILLIELH